MGWPSGLGGTRGAGCFRVALVGDYMGDCLGEGVGCGGQVEWAVIPLGVEVGVGTGGLGARRSVGVRGLGRPPSGLGRGAILRGGLW